MQLPLQTPLHYLVGGVQFPLMRPPQIQIVLTGYLVARHRDHAWESSRWAAGFLATHVVPGEQTALRLGR